MTDPTPPDAADDATPADNDLADNDLEQKQSLLDRFRGTGVGVEDPNIVGDSGPADVSPGRDPDTAPPGA
jgi:hypothetical protein